MPDNVTANPGSGGATFASDDIGGVQFPRMKVAIGADGVNDGDVSSSNPMPVRASNGSAFLAAKALSVAPVDADVAQVVQSVIHGRSTAGGGTFVDVKVNPSGALVADVGLPETATRPLDNASPGTPVRAIGQEVWSVSFADTGASVLSSDFTSPIVTGGVTYNQGTSALNVVASTNVNAEFLTRSTVAWRGAMRLKFGIVASQRIANNNFAVLLADLIGEGLAYTINSATSVTVTVPGHTFTSLSVGQFINLGGITGAAGVPGRYAIASVVAGTSITFTVAGWPVSGSGTLTLFGHSYVRNLFTGVTATNVAWDAQRRGWATGDTTATINTTASPGTVIHNELTGRECFMMDQLRASSTQPNVATRASRIENIPDDNLDLYIWIWNFNGTVSPASATTFTLGFIALEKFANTPVYVQGFRALGDTNAPRVAISGVANGVSLSTGQAAHDAAITGNPVRIAGRALTANYAAVATGDVADLVTTLVGALIQKPYAIPESDWSYAAAAGGIVNTTDVPVRAAAAAGIRNYVTAATFSNASATVATEVVIKDGASTVLWRESLPALTRSYSVVFPTPLRGTAATAVNVACITTGAQVYVNMQGYIAP
ncbi:MAG: hypothetical protein ING29_11315 [Azospirillum sp.]|nr:hypothetical protein [Azospirillum sp.]